MSTKKKSTVIVTVKKTKRKGNQRYTYTIDKPGNAAKETKREYYTRSYTAWQGALRQLGAVKTAEGIVCIVKGKAYPVTRA